VLCFYADDSTDLCRDTLCRHSWLGVDQTMLNTTRPVSPRAAPLAQSDPKALRRSSRLTIEIPVEVICKGTQNKMHTEETKTLVVSAHGCALCLKTSVAPGDKVVLIHRMSREEITCRVIMARQSKSAGWDIGVEFQEAAPNFWHIAFPPDDWDPSLRDQTVSAPVHKPGK
jgi:hypothetical protein